MELEVDGVLSVSWFYIFLSFFRASYYMCEADALHRKTRGAGMYWFKLASEYDG